MGVGFSHFKAWSILASIVQGWFRYNSSPEFMTTTFSQHAAGKVLWRMIALDLVWWNVNHFIWATLKLAQYTVFWCIFQFCLYTAIPDFVPSWPLCLFWGMDIGFTAVENTVWLSFPPGINPDWMMECMSWELPCWINLFSSKMALKCSKIFNGLSRKNIQAALKISSWEHLLFANNSALFELTNAET